MRIPEAQDTQRGLEMEDSFTRKEKRNETWKAQAKDTRTEKIHPEDKESLIIKKVRIIIFLVY